MPRDDRFILTFVIVIIVVWVFVVFLRWLYAPRKANLSFLDSNANDSSLKGEAVDLLEQEGYKVLYGKHKVPIKMIVDDNEDDPLTSQMFIDYFAQRDSKLYAVRLARERQLWRWSGSAIRDHLLPFSLVYDEIAGVLYVDLKHSKVRKITFVLDDDGIN